MSVIMIIVIGFIVGVIAKLLMPGRDPGGFIITTLLGIAGAFVGTWIGRAAGYYGPGQGAGFIASVLGAIVILLLYRLLIGRRRRLL